MSAVPGTGAAAGWVRAPERGSAFALRAARIVALWGGRRVARALLLHPIALYFVVSASGPRRHALRFLGRAFGRPARWRDAYRLFFNFAATVLDRVYLLNGRLDGFDVQVEGAGLAAVHDAARAGRGAFLVGAHLGSFEALATAGRALAALRVAMVMYPDNARLIEAALDAIAPGAERPAIIGLGRVDAMLAIRDWLDGGGFAGMLGDRSAPGASARAGQVAVPFLGRDATFGDGPFRLAALLRRRVIFMAGLYDGGARYRVRFEPLADFTSRETDAAAREARIRAAVVAYAERLEALAREAPYNWFNFHDFWAEDEK